MNKYEKLGKDYHWKEYRKNSHYTRHVNRIAKWFSLLIEDLNYPPSILDVGCGGGVISWKLAEIGMQVTGIDTEPLAIEAAKNAETEHGGNALFICDDIRRIDIIYDYILASEVIERFKNGDEFIDIVFPLFNKKMILSTPLSYKGKKVEAHHAREYTLGEMNDLVRRHFTKCDVFVIEPHIYVWAEK